PDVVHQRCQFLSSHHTPPTDIYTFPYTTLFRSCRPVSPSMAALNSAISECDNLPSASDCMCGKRSWSSGASSSRKLAKISSGRSDRKSTRLNSSHVKISYAVFCLKKKKNLMTTI